MTAQPEKIAAKDALYKEVAALPTIKRAAIVLAAQRLHAMLEADPNMLMAMRILVAELEAQ